MITRFTFSDVTPTSLRWNDGISRDGGRSWETRWIMEFTRRDPITDLPLVNVPLPSRAGPRLCDSAEAREFDFVLGRWKGEDSSVDHRTVSVESLQILDGCASMDFVEIQENDEANELFFVRAYDLSLGRWVLYSISTAEPTFGRYEGSVDGGRAVLTSGRGEAPSDILQRLAWSVVAPDTLRLEIARSTDEGALGKPAPAPCSGPHDPWRQSSFRGSFIRRLLSISRARSATAPVQCQPSAGQPRTAKRRPSHGQPRTDYSPLASLDGSFKLRPFRPSSRRPYLRCPSRSPRVMEGQVYANE